MSALLLARPVRFMGRPMVSADWLRLGFAAICMDCEAIFDMRNEACSNCAGHAWELLARWLERGGRP